MVSNLRYIPGRDDVDWSRSTLQQHARRLWDAHRPDRALAEYRLKWFLVPRISPPAAVCRVCLTAWPCRYADWAGDNLPRPAAATASPR